MGGCHAVASLGGHVRREGACCGSCFPRSVSGITGPSGATLKAMTVVVSGAVGAAANLRLALGPCLLDRHQPRHSSAELSAFLTYGAIRTCHAGQNARQSVGCASWLAGCLSGRSTWQ